VTGRDGRGSVTAMTAAVLAGLVLITTLVLGGSAVLRARSDAFGVAASAARAGAQALQEDALVQGDVVIDPTAAEAAALEFLATRGATGQVTVVGTDVSVTVEDSVDVPQLGRAVAIEATATVSAIKGATP
jgi:hypothetical protein